ncbi:MAG: beta strand repeat-containing protein, partial [Tepidisphaerales bacterium]
MSKNNQDRRVENATSMKSRRSLRRKAWKLAAAVAGVGMLFAASARATNWTAADYSTNGNTNWTNAANWSGGVPGAAADAIFDPFNFDANAGFNAYTVNIPDTSNTPPLFSTVKSLQFLVSDPINNAPSYSFNLNAGMPYTLTLNAATGNAFVNRWPSVAGNYNSVSLGYNVSLNIANAGFLNSGRLNANGPLVFNGLASASTLTNDKNGFGSFGGTVTFTNGGTIGNISDSQYAQNGGIASFNNAVSFGTGPGTIANSGSGDLSFSNLVTIAGVGTITNNDTAVTRFTGTLSMAGGGTITNNSTLADPSNSLNIAKLLIPSGSTVFPVLSGPIALDALQNDSDGSLYTMAIASPAVMARSSLTVQGAGNTRFDIPLATTLGANSYAVSTLTKSGTGRLTLTQNYSVSGNPTAGISLYLNQGELQLASLDMLGGSNRNIASMGNDGAATLTLTGTALNQSITMYQIGSNPTSTAAFNIPGGSTLTLVGTPGAGVNVSGGPGATGAVTTYDAIANIGGGTLVLSDPNADKITAPAYNTFRGNIRIDSGVVVAPAPKSLGNGFNTVVFNGGTLRLLDYVDPTSGNHYGFDPGNGGDPVAGAAPDYTNPNDGDHSRNRKFEVAANGGTLDLQAAYLLINDVNNAAGNAAGQLWGSGTLTVRNTSATKEVPWPAGPNGPASMTPLGRLLLDADYSVTNNIPTNSATGTIPFTGNIVIEDGGHVRLGNANGAGGAGGGSITINSGGTLANAATGVVPNAIILNSGGKLGSSQRDGTFGGPITINANATFDSADADTAQFLGNTTLANRTTILTGALNDGGNTLTITSTTGLDNVTKGLAVVNAGSSISGTYLIQPNGVLGNAYYSGVPVIPANKITQQATGGTANSGPIYGILTNDASLDLSGAGMLPAVTGDGNYGYFVGQLSGTTAPTVTIPMQTIAADHRLTAASETGGVLLPTDGTNSLTLSGAATLNVVGATLRIERPMSPAIPTAEVQITGNATGNVLLTGTPTDYTFQNLKLSSGTLLVDAGHTLNATGTGRGVHFNGGNIALVGGGTVGGILQVDSSDTIETLASSGTSTISAIGTIPAGKVLLTGGAPTINVAQGTSLNITASIDDGGNNYGITKAGLGTLRLSVPNTFGGQLVVNGGVLHIDQTALAAGAGAGLNKTIVLNGSGSLKLSGVQNYGPGLTEGLILGNAQDFTSPNPGLALGGTYQTGPAGATVVYPLRGENSTINAANNSAPGVGNGSWNKNGNETWVYSGQVYSATGVFAFAENIDDNVQIKIDGNIVLQNTNGSVQNGYNVITSTASTSGMTGATAYPGSNPFGGTTNFGPGVNGWHTVEIRVGNGGGGAGPVVDTTNHWTSTFGLGFTQGVPASPFDGNSYGGVAGITDPGNGSLFRILSGLTGLDLSAHDLDAAGPNTSIDLSATDSITNQVSKIGNVALHTGNSFTVYGAGRTLKATSTTLNGSNGTITIASAGADPRGDASFITGAIADGSNTGIILNIATTGSLTLDNTSLVTPNDLNGTTINLNTNGLLTAIGNSTGSDPLAGLTLNVIGTGGTLGLTTASGSGNVTFNAQVILNAAGNINHTGTTSDTLGTNGTVVTMNGNNLTVDVAASGGLTLNGVLSDNGSAGLIKNNTGTLTLGGTGANTFTGQSFVNGGTLNLNKPAGTQAIGSVQVNAGGTLTNLASNQILDSATLTMNGGTYDLHGNTEFVNTILGTSSVGVTSTIQSSTGTSGRISTTLVNHSGAGTTLISAPITSTLGSATWPVSAGTLQFSNIANSGTTENKLQGVTLDVNGGTVNAAGGQSGSLSSISGATVRLSNAGALVVPPGVSEPAQGFIAKIYNINNLGWNTNLLPVLTNTTNLVTPYNPDFKGAINFGGPGGATGFNAALGNTYANNDNWTTTWTGYFLAPVTGAYSFKIPAHDDDAGVWIDVNRNGQFETAGSLGNELIVSAPGCCNSVGPFTVNLTGGQFYPFAFVQQNGNGGSGLEVQWADPGGTLADASGSVNRFFAATSQPTLVTQHFDDVNVVVAASTTGSINLTNLGSAVYKSLTLNNGSDLTANAITLSPTPLTVSFTNTVLPVGGGTVTTRGTGGLVPGIVDDSAYTTGQTLIWNVNNNATVNGALILNNVNPATPNHLSHTTFSVNSGVLQLTPSSIGTNADPIGGAGIVLNGGTLRITNLEGSGSATTTVTQGLTVTAPSSIDHTGTTTDNLVVNANGANPGISISSGNTLTLQGTGGTLDINAVVTDNGAAPATTTMIVNGSAGTMVLTGGTANILTGTTVVNAGTVALQKPDGVSAIGTVNIMGGTVKNFANQQVSGNITLNGTTAVFDTNSKTQFVPVLNAWTGSTADTGGLGALSTALVDHSTGNNATIGGRILARANLAGALLPASPLTVWPVSQGQLAFTNTGPVATANDLTNVRLRVDSGATLAAQGDLSSANRGSLNNATVTLNGGTFQVGAKSEGVIGKLYMATGLGVNANNYPLYTNNTNIGTVEYTGAVNFPNTAPNNGADGPIGAVFGNPVPGPQTNANYSTTWTTNFFAPTTGTYTFAVFNQDDTAAVWLDLNQNGIFESNGSKGNEMLQSLGCCGNTTQTVTANLVGGQSYLLSYAMEDTGGGSGLTAMVGLPGGSLQPLQNALTTQYLTTTNVEAIDGTSSTILAKAGTSFLGRLTIDPTAMLTINGVNRTVNFAETRFDNTGSGSTITFNSNAALGLGKIVDTSGGGLPPAGTWTLTNTGTGTIILNNTTSANDLSHTNLILSQQNTTAQVDASGAPGAFDPLGNILSIQLNATGALLRITNKDGLGPAMVNGGVSLVSGAQLQMRGTVALNNSGANTVSIAGTGLSNDGAIRATSGTPSIGGPVNLTADSSIQSDGGATLTLANITTTTHANLTVQGVGNVTIGNLNLNADLGTSGALFKNNLGYLTFTGNQATFPVATPNWTAGIIAFTGPQSFGAYTIPAGHALQFNSDPGAGVDVLVPAGLSLISGITTQADMTGLFTGAPNNRIDPASAGTFALRSSTSLNINMNADNLTSFGIGAIGLVNYSGTITPASTGYLFTKATAGTGPGLNVLSISGPLTGNNNVRIVSSIVDFSKRPDNTSTTNYVGRTSVTGGGTLRYVDDPDLGAPADHVTLDGGTLQYMTTTSPDINRTFGFLGSGLQTAIGLTWTPTGAGSSVRTIDIGDGGGTIDVVGSADNYNNTNLAITGTNGLTSAAATNSATAAASVLTKTGYGRLTVLAPIDGTGANPGFKGTIVLPNSSSYLNILTMGYLRGQAGIEIDQGSILQVDNNITNSTQREFQFNAQVNPSDPLGFTTESDKIGNNIPILLKGGSLILNAKNITSGVGTGTLERVGTVTLGQGMSNLTATRNGGGADLMITNLIRNTADHSTVVFNSSGGNTQIGTSGDFGRIVPLQINGAAPADNTLLPWATIDGVDFAVSRTQASLFAAGGIMRPGNLGTTAYTTLATTTAPGAGGFVGGATNLGNATADVTLGLTTGLASQNFSVGALRLAGGATRNIFFANTTANNPDTLYVESGDVMSDNSNNNRNIGFATTLTIGSRGRLTAGVVGATTPQELFIHNNNNTFAIYSQIIDNPGGGAVSLITDLNGSSVDLYSGSQAPATSVANSYSGGTWVLRGTVNAKNSGTLGSGPVLIKNARVNLDNVGSTTGTSLVPGTTVGYTLVDNAWISLNNGSNNAAGQYNTNGDRFNLAAGTTICGNFNPAGAGYGLNSLTRVSDPSLLTTGGTIYLAPGAIVRHNPIGSAEGVGTATIQNIGANADLYYAPNGAGAGSVITVGTGTSWMGMSSTRDDQRMDQGTIVANSDFYLQGLTFNATSTQLLLGSQTAGTTYAITNAAGTPINAFIKGRVTLDSNGNSVSMPSNLTLVGTPGSILTANWTNSLGVAPNQAKLDVQGGGSVYTGGYTAVGANPDPSDPSGLRRNLPSATLPSPLNNVAGGNVFEAGSRLYINQGIGIGSAPIGSFDMKADSILSVNTDTPFGGRGTQPFGGPVDTTGLIPVGATLGAPGQFVFETGAIIRLDTDPSVNGQNYTVYGLDKVINGQGVVLELPTGDRSLSQMDPYTIASFNQSPTVTANPALTTTKGTFVPSLITIGTGGMLTNSSQDQTFRQSRGGVVLSDGTALAATTMTFLFVQQAFQISANANITIGSLKWVENMPKLGTVQLNQQFSNTAGPGAKATVLNGAQLFFNAQNVWPDTAAIDLPGVVTNYSVSSINTTVRTMANGSTIQSDQGGFTEVIGPLTGVGSVIGNSNISLGVGYGDTAGFTSSVIFKATNGQNPELVKLGTSKMTYTGMSDSNAPLIVAQGELSISGAGNTKFGAARPLKGGTLTLDNSNAAGGVRAFATLPAGSRFNNVSNFFVAPSGGTLQLIGNETSPVVEYVPNFATGATFNNNASNPYFYTTNGGYTTINIQPNATTPQQTTLAVASLDRFDNSNTRDATYVIHSPSITNVPGSYSTAGVYTPSATPNTNGLIVVQTPNLGQGSSYGLAVGASNVTNAIGTAAAPTWPHILGEIAPGDGTLGFMTEDLRTYTNVGTTASSNILTATSTTGLAVGMTVSGVANIPANSVITSITDATHFTIGNPTSTFFATVTAGSNAITTTTAGAGVNILANGLTVTGAGIPAGSIIEGLNGTSFTITTPAGSLTGTWTVPTGGVVNTTVTGVSSTANLVDGMVVTGTGIPAGASIVAGSITANSFILNAAATAAGTTAALRLPALNNVTSTNTEQLTFSGGTFVAAGNNNNATNAGTNTMTVPAGLRLLTNAEYDPFINGGGSGSINSLNMPINVKLPGGTVRISGNTRISTLTLAGNAGASNTIDVTAPVGLSAIPSQLELSEGGLLVKIGTTGNINGSANTVLRSTGGVGLYLHTEGDLNLNARAYSDTSLTKTGPGTLNVGDNGLSFTRNTLEIDDGTVSLGTNNSFLAIRGQNGFSGLNLFMNGGELKLNGNSQNINQLNSSNPMPGAGTGGGTISNLATSPTATLTIGSGNSGSSFSGQLTGNINLDKVGNSTQLLTGASNITGTTTVRGGELRLRDLGQIAGTSNVALTYGTLNLYDGYLNHVDNRIPSGVNVDMKGSTFVLEGAPGLVSNQVLGNVNLLAGRNDFQSYAGGAGASVITIANLTNLGHTGSTVNFNANTGFIGSTAGNAGATIRDLIGNINGTALDATHNYGLTNNILPAWMVVNGNNFATYRPGTGISYLSNTADGYATYDNNVVTPADWTATSATSPQVVAGPTHNISDNTARTLTVSKTLNAFKETGGVTNTFNANVGLTLASGGLITDSGNMTWANAVNTTGQYLTSGSGELDIWVNQNTTSINVPITNNPLTPSTPMDLVKSGGSTLSLNPASLYTATAFAAGATSITLTSVAGLSPGMFVGNGSASIFPVVNTTNNTPFSNTITSIVGNVITLSNPVGATGGSDLRILVNGNSYTGTTYVNSGPLNLSMPGANGTTFVTIPGNLVIQGGPQGNIVTVNESTVANQISSSANVTLAGNARLNLASVPGVVETLASVTFADAGGNNGTTMNLARAALERTSILNLTAPVAITTNNTNPAVTPYLDTWLGRIGFTNTSGTGSTLNINGPTLANGLGAMGLRVDAVIDSAPASIPGGSLIKTGTGILYLNQSIQIPNCTETNTSNQITNLDTTNFYVGMPISGNQIPNGAYVTAFVPGIGTAGSATISVNATQSNTANQTFTFTPAPSQQYVNNPATGFTTGTGYNGTLASLTDLINVQQGILRVDRYSALGSNSTNTTVQSGAVLLGGVDPNANANMGLAGSIKLMPGSTLGMTSAGMTFGAANVLLGQPTGLPSFVLNNQSVMNVVGPGTVTFAARDYFMTSANSMTMNIASKLTGSGNINIVGPDTLLAGVSTVTLSNPLTTGNTGGNDYSGTITVGPNVTLLSQAATTLNFTVGVTVTSLSPTITIPATAAQYLSVGEVISGNGIPASSTIATIAGTTITMSNPQSTPTVSTTAASTTVTTTNTAGFVVGGPVNDPSGNIPAGATIATIVNGTSFTISAAATGTATGIVVNLPNNNNATAAGTTLAARQTAVASNLGTAGVVLNGGRLSVRDDGNLMANMTSGAITYNNPLTLNANSYLDANRTNTTSLTPTANIAINFPSMTVNGTNTLTVDSGNGFQIGLGNLLGTGTLIKAGQSQLNVTAASPATFTTGLGIAGPVGELIQPTYTTTGYENMYLPANTTVSSFTVNGSYITATNKTLNISGALSVNPNPGNISGMLAVQGSTTVTAGSVVNNGMISGAVAAATITSTGGFSGNGIYAAGATPLTLAGPVLGGSPTIAGVGTVSVTAPSITAATTVVSSGTLRLAPTGPLTITNPISIMGNAAAAPSPTASPIAANGGTLQFDGGAQPIIYNGNIPNAGTIRATSGTTTINGVISGGVASYVPGLLEGYVNNGALDATAARPGNPGNFGVTLGTRMAQTNIVTQNAYTGHLDNDLWIYTGYVHDDDGVFSFAGLYDDRFAVWIDGNLVLNNAGGGGNNPATTAFTTNNTGTPSQNFGPGITLPGLGGGWHLFEARFNNGNGGAGPVVNSGFNNNYGFGYKNGIGAINGADYVKPVDNGTGNLFVTQVNTAAKGNVQVDAGGTLNATQIIQTANATLGAGITGGTLNITGPAPSQIDMLTVAGAGSATLTNNAAGASALTLGGTNISSGTTLNHTATLNTVITGNALGGGTINSTNAGLTFSSPTNGAQTSSVIMAGNGGMNKEGTGTLSLLGNSTYAGPTNINNGTVRLSPATIVTLADFTSTAQWTTTGNGGFTGSVLSLTTGGGGQATSAFFNTKVPVTSAFAATFTFTDVGGGGADGAAFILQNQAINALGINGGGLGYQNITPSAAVELNVYSGNTPGTGYGVNGAAPVHPFATTGSVNLASGNPIQVQLSYDGSNVLTETLTDQTTLATYTTSYVTGSLATQVGGSPAWVGFSGGSGGVASTLNISGFSMTTGAPGGLLPTATQLNIASGATMDLNNSSQTIGALNGPAGSLVTLGTGTLTVAGGPPAGSFAGTISGAGSLAVSGTGHLTLTNANTYLGGTAISGGTLVAANGSTGSATGPGAVTLNGGTLAGNLAGGSIAGPVLAGTGPHTIAPGAGLTAGTFGTLTLNGGLTTNSNTTLAFNLGAPVSGGLYNGDLLFVNGGLTAGA